MKRGDFFACLSKDLGDISGIPDKWRGNIWKSQTPKLQGGYLYVCHLAPNSFTRKCKKLINQFCDCLRACRIGFDF